MSDFNIVDFSLSGDLKISKGFSLTKKEGKEGKTYLDLDLSLGTVADIEQGVYPSPAGAVGLHYGGQHQIVNLPLDKKKSSNSFQLNASFYGNAILSSFMFFPSYPIDFGSGIVLPFDPRLRIGGQFIGMIEGKFNLGSRSLALRLASELNADFGVNMIFSRFPYINNEISYPSWMIGASLTFDQYSLYYLTGFNLSPLDGLVPLPHEIGLTLRPFNNFEINFRMFVPDPKIHLDLSYRINNHILGISFRSGNNLEGLYTGVFWRWNFGSRSTFEISGNIEPGIHARGAPPNPISPEIVEDNSKRITYGFKIDPSGKIYDIDLSQNRGFDLDTVKKDVPSEILNNLKYKGAEFSVHRDSDCTQIYVFLPDKTDHRYTVWKNDQYSPLTFNLVKYASLNGFI
ncbi:MAG: hypothetical protein FD145_1184 [Candidatus Saganbacteria bacterium]|uniref:Uncharacterized protein n=1 Tax=Candidatus Saganbacteria bacterium TaxID=2575572 RepID=A0A833L0D0_UNCSA|nr:MAG: hypothetical protein FD145_1184 [Candidatus Saganbacteria bacterium]